MTRLALSLLRMSLRGLVCHLYGHRPVSDRCDPAICLRCGRVPA